MSIAWTIAGATAASVGAITVSVGAITVSTRAITTSTGIKAISARTIASIFGEVASFGKLYF